VCLSHLNLLTFQQGGQRIHLFHRRLQPLADQCGNLFGFWEVINRMGIVVLEPTNVEIITTFGNLRACEAAEAPCFALVDALTDTVTFTAVARFKCGKVCVRQRRAFAERWHVGP
jgi:hypothetical protein